MRPVLSAMKSREQALNTVQMLERDLEAKRTKVRQLEIEPKKQAKVQYNLKGWALTYRASMCLDRSVERRY